MFIWNCTSCISQNVSVASLFLAGVVGAALPGEEVAADVAAGAGEDAPPPDAVLPPVAPPPVAPINEI